MVLFVDRGRSMSQILAKAGIYCKNFQKCEVDGVDSRLRGNDGRVARGLAEMTLSREGGSDGILVTKIPSCSIQLRHNSNCSFTVVRSGKESDVTKPTG